MRSVTKEFASNRNVRYKNKGRPPETQTTSIGGGMRTVSISVVLVTLLFAVSASAQSAQSQVTFTKDVAPILQARCQICHHPSTFAPMSLMTYEEARPWAKSIKEKVLMREMPPWHLDKNVGVQYFSNDISLTDEQIATIAKWVDGGAVR